MIYGMPQKPRQMLFSIMLLNSDLYEGFTLQRLQGKLKIMFSIIDTQPLFPSGSSVKNQLAENARFLYSILHLHFNLS